jgi:DNA-binding CsgD family transcriptional regulator
MAYRAISATLVIARQAARTPVECCPGHGKRSQSRSDSQHRGTGFPAAPVRWKLSTGERQLVILVAQGRTDAQIAAQLYISVPMVSSDLDRIRDKTGCRRRADLTRLALSAGLV